MVGNTRGNVGGGPGAVNPVIPAPRLERGAPLRHIRTARPLLPAWPAARAESGEPPGRRPRADPRTEFPVKIRLRFFASLRERTGVSELDLECADGTTVEALRRDLASRFGQRAGFASTRLASVNWDPADP